MSPTYSLSFGETLESVWAVIAKKMIWNEMFRREQAVTGLEGVYTKTHGSLCGHMYNSGP
jgi:hypothetical protein